MKITKRHLQLIIREAIELSSRDIEEYLRTQADSYWSDRALVVSGPGGQEINSAIRELLLDDFLDNIGSSASIDDYSELIDHLSRPPYEDADTPAMKAARQRQWGYS
jgi:hypothetical protein